MKTNTNVKPKNGKPGQRPVRDEYEHPTAGAVCIAGTFNDWHPRATSMIPLGDGRWRKELTLSPGDYEYCLVVDGRWLPDPLAAETVPNPFGGLNSIRKVGNGG